MKVLIVNAILYTSESVKVNKVQSIKDCMIYDLCMAFHEKGHDVTLVAADNYKPIVEENYPFKIVWMKSYFEIIFIPNKIPFNKEISSFLKKNHFDLIICSEVFSMDTLLTVRNAPDKTIIWQEMAFHQKMAKQMASKFWHNVIIKLFYSGVRVVPRTENAKEFISHYCDNVSDTIIPHGVNLELFKSRLEKEKHFVVVSQLIERKRIDQIIKAFREFSEKNHSEYKLYIIGDGDCREQLENQAKDLDNIIFTGKKNHDEMMELLSSAKAMLVYTRKDNSMISIAESLAVCTPVITTSIPDNARTIKQNELGIVKDEWTYEELEKIVDNNDTYINNCLHYRENLDNKHNVDLFIMETKKMK